MPKRPIAAALVAALIVASPGESCYRAWAQVKPVDSGRLPLEKPPGIVTPGSPSASTGGISLTPATLKSDLPGPINALQPTMIAPLPSAAKEVYLPVAPIPSAVQRADAAALSRAVQPSSAVNDGPPTAAQLLESAETLALPVEKVAAMPPGEARAAGEAIIDRVLGVKSSGAGSLSEEPVPVQEPVPAGLDGSLDRARPDGKRGFLGRARDKIAAPFRVLPGPERNKQFWLFVLGQSILTFGIAFHQTALQKIVAPRKQDAAKLGENRAVNWAAQAVSSLTMGPYIDKHPVQNVLVWTYLGRAVALASVPLLFFHGAFSLPGFLVIIFAAGFFQSVSATAGSVAFQRIIGEHDEYYNRANSVYNLMIDLVGIIGPLIAGTFIGLMNMQLGFQAGNALAYGVYAALAVLVAVVYWKFLRLPGAEPKPAARKPVRELLEGFRLVWGDRYLRLTLFFSTIYMMIADALVFGAIGRYVDDVLGPTNTALPGAEQIPVIGKIISALTSSTGAFGLYLAASSLGLSIAAFFMMRLGRKAPREEDARLKLLQRQGLWSSILMGFSMFAYWGVFFAPSLWASLAAMVLVALMHGPAGVVWASITQIVLQKKYPDDLGKVYSAMFFYQLVCSIIGVLTFGYLLGVLPTVHVLWIACAALTISGILDIIVPFVVFPLDLGPRSPSK